MDLLKPLDGLAPAKLTLRGWLAPPMRPPRPPHNPSTARTTPGPANSRVRRSRTSATVVHSGMRKFCLAILFLAGAAWAVNIKLYMKDGSYQLVREYQTQADRVRFYSVERAEWEEIPLDLVDLKRTQAEAAAREEQFAKDNKDMAEEAKAEHEFERERRRIPQDPGVYWLDGEKAVEMKAAESSVHTNKGRSVLAKLAPVPMVSGKGTLEVEGAHSANVFSNPEQEFYIQLSETERFGLFKLLPGKGGVRIVENLTFMPVTKEIVEEPVVVESFQKELDSSGLYKIWPREPLPPGEYAVMEFTEGKLNAQVWDFAIKAK